MAKRGPKGRQASPTEMFLARHTGQMGDTSETVRQGDDAAVVGRTGPALVQVYKPTPYGYKPVLVPSSNLAWVVSQGYLEQCPDCGGLCEADMNSCPGRAKIPYRVCPVASCRKPVFDNVGSAPDAVGPNPDDPSLIKDDSYLESTPELRTKAALDAHMAAYHATEAPALAPRRVEVRSG